MSLSKGLVGYWPLDRESLQSATTFGDKTPRENVATSANVPVFTTDRMGNSDRAMSFNGTSDYCFSDDTEVLTKLGWKLFADVKYEDSIATLDPSANEMVYQNPSRLFNYKYTGKMCHFYGQHLDALVTPDHHVYVAKYKSGNDWLPYNLETAGDVLNDFIRFKKDCIWDGDERESFTLPSIKGNYRVGYPDQAERNFPMDTWLSFFGWWITEGCTADRKNLNTQSTNYQIIISQSRTVNPEKCNDIENTIEELGWRWSYSGCNYYIYTGYNKQLVKYLSRFGLSADKYIPNELKQLSSRQLEILYNTMMSGDGHANQYYSVSKQLIDDVQEICIKIGYGADVSYYSNRKYPIWCAHVTTINSRPRINDNRTNRVSYGKGVETDYDGIVYGLTVPNDHIIYVRRNGKGVWIGNCDCGNDASLDITGAITISAWVNVSVLPGADKYIMGYSPAGSEYRYILFLNQQTISAAFRDNVSMSITTGNFISIDTWYHIVYTAIAGSTEKIYVNGVDTGASGTAGSTAWAGGDVHIGNLRDTAALFDGSLADVRIYNRALSQQEITLLAESYRPKILLQSQYGVSWDESANTYDRTGTTKRFSCSSTPGNSYLPIHADMRRCVMSDGGVVQYYLDPTDSTKKADGTASDLTGGDGQVMVEIPKFYYKQSYSGTTHTWEIARGPIAGFSLHPAFMKDGSEVNHRYIGAYEGSMWDATTSAMVPSGSITSNMYASGDKLCSISAEYPKTNEMRSEFRTMASERGAGWRQLDFDLNSAVQLLYIIEYADFDSQTEIGYGRTQLSGGTWTAGSYIGQCGKSNSDGDGTNSVAGNTNDAYMTYRGIENWYGNVWKWNDGININDHVPYVTNNASAWADDTATGYTDLGVTLPAANNYQITLADTDRGFLPASVGASATYVSDYYYQNTGWRVVLLGGSAYSGANAGAFCMYAYYAASAYGVHIGGRLSR